MLELSEIRSLSHSHVEGMRKKLSDKETTYDGRVVNVFTWGTGEGGQLGHGLDTPIMQSVPRPVFPIDPSVNHQVVRAAAGGRHTLFLAESGTLLACGEWSKGQLGCKDRPFERVSGTTVPFFVVPGGGQTTPIAVKVHHKLVVTNIAAGFSSSFLLTNSGEVWSWGSGKYGCLGLGHQEGRWYPERIAFFAEGQGVTVESISAGKWHAICLTQQRKMYAWGRNNWGQLGNGETGAYECSPIEVCLAKQETPLQVSAGAEHCGALVDLLRPNRRRDVVAFAWGNPGNGRVGTQRERTHATPLEVGNLTEVLRKSKRKPTSLSCGGSHTLAVLSSGEVAAWGGGGYGQLGDGHMWDRPEPVMVSGLHGVQSASAGGRHSIALVVYLAGTQVWGWGFNRWGEVGVGDDCVRLQPERVGGLDGCTVKDAIAGERHTIALTNGKALRVKDLREYRHFIDVFDKEGLMVYDSLKKTMVEKNLNPDWLDTPLEYFPGQPGMTDAECLQGTRELHMDWCMDAAPPNRCAFDNLRGGREVVYLCRPCQRERICIACARKCHSKHSIEPTFRLRNDAEPCDCSVTPGMCTCKWSPMRVQFRKMTSVAAPRHPALGEDGSLHSSELRNLLQVVRGGAGFVTAEDVEDGFALLTQGGENEWIDFLQFERWYEEYFGKIDAKLEGEDA